MLSKYYFTFGDDPGYPYEGGWVTVIAENMTQAMRFFAARFPCDEGLVCAEVYPQGEFRKTGMYLNGNRGRYSHEVIGIIKRRKK